MEVVDNLRLSEAKLLAYIVADPDIRLVWDEEVDIAGGIPVSLQSFLNYLTEAHDRVFENGARSNLAQTNRGAAAGRAKISLLLSIAVM